MMKVSAHIEFVIAKHDLTLTRSSSHIFHRFFGIQKKMKKKILIWIKEDDFEIAF